MLKITIPKPCNQNWNDMQPSNGGRFCNACAKTIVDFTVMADEEVKFFLLDKKQEKVCGRFTDNQLDKIKIIFPENILSTPMPYWKKFLTVSLIIFSSTLFSCNTNYDATVGMIISAPKEITSDTTHTDSSQSFVGKLKFTDPIPLKNTCKVTLGTPVNLLINGDTTFTELPPLDTVKLGLKKVGEIMISSEKDSTKLNSDSCENKSYQ